MCFKINKDFPNMSERIGYNYNDAIASNIFATKFDNIMAPIQHLGKFKVGKRICYGLHKRSGTL